MRRDGWTKYFVDNTIEEGYDDLVSARKASWSKGRLTGIESVELRHSGICLDVNLGDGIWHQQDTMISNVVAGTISPGIVVARFVGRQFNEQDVGKKIALLSLVTHHSLRFTENEGQVVEPKMFGSWIVGCINVEKKVVQCFLCLDKNWKVM